MTVLKPPAKCPCCGEEIGSLAKTWEKIRGGGRDALRIPVALTATYHCGAIIAAKFIVKSVRFGSASSSGNGAHWEIQVENGCPATMMRALNRVPVEGGRRTLFD